MKINSFTELIKNKDNLTIDELFLYSCKFNYYNGVKFALDNNFYNQEIFDYDITYTIILIENIQILKMLLDKCEIKKYVGGEILKFAIFNNKIEIVKFLISYGIEFNISHDDVVNLYNEKYYDMLLLSIENGANFNFFGEPQKK
jgi:hypothetical protein